MTENSAPALGIIMLDTSFPRPPGDVGHAASWRCPVRLRRVTGATADVVIRQGAAGLLPAFIDAGNALVAEGCCALVTSCGFMAPHQQAIAKALPVPFAASSLMQVPSVAAGLPAGRVPGILTYDAASLSPQFLRLAGLDPSLPVIGMPKGGAFQGMIEGGQPYDADALQAEMLAAAERLISQNPAVGAIISECTNMPPFSHAISRATGLAVFDILTLGHWLHHASSPRHFTHEPEINV